jgi:hypothetical protein
MTDKDTVASPQNVEEFNAITGLVFAELYKEFPVHVSMNKDFIARKMGVSTSPDALLPSGRLFKQIVPLTLSWLVDEGYIRGLDGKFDISRPWNDLVLSEKGFRALEAVPPSIGKSVGSHLKNLSDQLPAKPSAYSQIAEVVGSFIGSAAGALPKSIGK